MPKTKGKDAPAAEAAKQRPRKRNVQGATASTAPAADPAPIDAELDAMFANPASAPPPRHERSGVKSAAVERRGAPAKAREREAGGDGAVESSSSDEDDEDEDEDEDEDDVDMVDAIKESGLDWSGAEEDAELEEASQDEADDSDGPGARHGWDGPMLFSESSSEDEGEDEGEEEGEDTDGRQDADKDEDDASTEDDEESQGGDVRPPVHEALAEAETKARLSERAARKAARLAEPREARDARSIFVGNVPIAATTSKSVTRALKSHLRSLSLYPSVTRIESVRYRSVPLAVPTGDYAAATPEEAEGAARRRARSRAHRIAQMQSVDGGRVDAAAIAAAAEAQGQTKTYLTPAQKRRVAYIRDEVNERATSVNAYVTLARPEASELLRLRTDAPSQHRDPTLLTAPVLCALLAARADDTLFQGRHLRVDMVTPLDAEERAEAGLDAVLTPRGLPLGTPARQGSAGGGGGAGAPSAADARRTLFVGNLDFEADEESLRDFFERLLREERGEPPVPDAIDWTKLARLPVPEAAPKEGKAAAADHSSSDDEGASSKPESSSAARPEAKWVTSVRLIRDSATQLGKGFGYVRFVDEACVDELLALSESENAFLEATKRGAAGGKNAAQRRNAAASQARALGEAQFKRRLKFQKRPLRLARCASGSRAAAAKRKGSNAGGTAGAAQRTPLAERRSTARGGGGSGGDLSRSRSKGAPTPDGTSPFASLSRAKRSAAAALSSSPAAATPTRKAGRRSVGEGGALELPPPPPQPQFGAKKAIANPPPARPRDADKAARLSAKRADPERRARRLDKKARKLAERRAVDGEEGGGGGRGGGGGAAKAKVRLDQAKAAAKVKAAKAKARAQGHGSGAKARPTGKAKAGGKTKAKPKPNKARCSLVKPSVNARAALRRPKLATGRPKVRRALLAVSLAAPLLPTTGRGGAGGGLVAGVTANTEIRNFGPVLCRADEIGHLAFRAALEVSREWPRLQPSPDPVLFSLLESDPRATLRWASSSGAWIVLDLAPEDAAVARAAAKAAEAAASSATDGGEGSQGEGVTDLRPADLASTSFPLLSAAESERLSPRDRLLQTLARRVGWLFTHRYTLRLSSAANHAADFEVTIHSPQSMLKAGGISWQAKPVRGADEKENVQPAQQEEAKSKPTAADPPVQDTGGGGGGGAGPTLMVGVRPTAPPPSASSSWSPSSGPTREQLEEEAPARIHRWPCPHLYAHIRATSHGVPIPPAAAAAYAAATHQRDGDGGRGGGGSDADATPFGRLHVALWRLLARLAEAYVGPLWGAAPPAPTTPGIDVGMGVRVIVEGGEADDRGGPTQPPAPAPLPIPIHLTLEPLWLGLVPANAVALLGLLLPTLYLALRVGLPAARRVVDAHAGAP